MNIGIEKKEAGKMLLYFLDANINFYLNNSINFII